MGETDVADSVLVTRTLSVTTASSPALHARLVNEVEAFASGRVCNISRRIGSCRYLPEIVQRTIERGVQQGGLVSGRASPELKSESLGWLANRDDKVQLAVEF